MDVDREPGEVKIVSALHSSTLIMLLWVLTTSNSFALSLAGTWAQGISQLIRAFMAKSLRLRCATVRVREPPGQVG